ncbi:hypothetical protein MH117_07975 [Paenibacillus sp. ACRRX]|uniref:hypothetical protein n=1 Tax=unclassified Paenibacillus TaxID=185978 RepID=UPI001EF41EE1|nr:MULTISPECIES: hypothetical protein [unclassified Paenibacillus]MCG7407355.1 hypothetical protein [Paenibacillus sp. ACRRX]MDK8180581.1 hypothetical protein [Paenibacillus sp. UMB4589-SE434]
MENINNMEDVLAQIKKFNERKMESLMAQLREARAQRKLERLQAPDEVSKEVEAPASASSPSDVTMEKWVSLLQELSKK